MVTGNNSKSFYAKWKKQIEKGMTMSILFTGVGGQGIIKATTVLAEAAMSGGLDVKVSEVHGMAQRGGSVVGSVRIGKRVYSPTIDKADIVFSLEKLEALRYLSMLNTGGFLLINNCEIVPVSLFFNQEEYPKDIISRISKFTKNYLIVEANSISKKLGEPRASNIVLLGKLSNFVPIKEEFFIQSIKKNIPPKAVDINIRAFKEGRRNKN
ncbi:MAG: indolepyruvate oxidoreductase subunit beta [Candidatus Humimicrobiaceae bacterium]